MLADFVLPYLWLLNFLPLFFFFFTFSQNELKTDCPHMCAYKLVTVKFRWWGLQTKVENFIHKVMHDNISTCAWSCAWSCAIGGQQGETFECLSKLEGARIKLWRMCHPITVIVLLVKYHFLSFHSKKSGFLQTSTASCSAGLTDGWAWLWRISGGWKKRPKKSSRR